MSDRKFVISHGNVIDGHIFIGTFDTVEEAYEYAGAEWDESHDYMVIELLDPMRFHTRMNR